jgi:drug/metabolite transporter (DMT)-like permease
VALPYFLILIAAVCYAVGALVVKRAAELGVGAWRTAFLANIIAALLYGPVLAFGGTVRWDLWWQPALVAVCYVTGQVFTFLSLDRGDVSVATPVLGLKILLVTVLVALWGGEPLRWQLWLAAMLATLGIALLNRRGQQPHHNVGRTIVTAGLAAVCYATLDVLVQRWAPVWGLGRFLPATMAMAAVFSLAFIPCFRAPLSAIPRAAWPWLLGGLFVIGLQALVFVTSVAWWGHVASINVVYASRGLWSVVLVWWLGHWVKSREQHLEHSVLRSRLAGALLMIVAIAMVVW